MKKSNIYKEINLILENNYQDIVGLKTLASIEKFVKSKIPSKDYTFISDIFLYKDDEGGSFAYYYALENSQAQTNSLFSEIFKKYSKEISQQPYESWKILSSLPENQQTFKQLEKIYKKPFTEFVQENLDAETFIYLDDSTFLKYITKNNIPDYQKSKEILNIIDNQQTNLNLLTLLILNGNLEKNGEIETQFLTKLKKDLKQHNFQELNPESLIEIFNFIENKNIPKIMEGYIEVLSFGSTKPENIIKNMITLNDFGLNIDKQIKENKTISQILSKDIEAVSYMLLTNRIEKETLLNFIVNQNLKKEATSVILNERLDKKEDHKQTNPLKV